ncbi:hypothetical protein [Rhodanobacter spathiphylli]|nr:hypothetical protein [Rhodanobacter spathiphylli]
MEKPASVATPNLVLYRNEGTPMHASRAIRSSNNISLRKLLCAAYLADPRDQLISPIGERDYSTLFGRIPVALAVLRMAAQIEPDPAAVMQWYRHTRITELGYLTAEQLVALGRAEAVITFLRSVRDGRRD